MIKKISIIGTGGVGSNLAFTILNKMSIDELVLVDIKQAQAEGIACDLEDTRGLLDFSTQIKATKNYSQIKDSDIVVFSAGLPRQQGMSRLGLLRLNADIARGAASAIKKYSSGSIVIVVTNPLDIISYLMLKETKFPRKRVMGMGSSLDTSRLLNILFKSNGVCVGSQQALVFGPHSKEMILNIDKTCYLGKKNNKQTEEEIGNKVKLRGAKIVELFKNKSAVFAPSLACYKLIEAIAFNKNQMIPVSVLLKGEYGLSNICLGIPCLINRQGADKVIERKLTPSQMSKLKKAGLSLQKTLKSL